MRILVVSYYFPPDPAVGAIRPGKIVEALRARGHEVDVVCGARDGQPPSDPCTHRVRPTRTPREAYLAWRLRSGRMSAPRAMSDLHESVGTTVPASVSTWKRYLFSLLWLPDDRQGFIWPAYREARRLGAKRFDLVYTSAPPFSAHLVGWLLKGMRGLRWIAEFRDPWLDGVRKPWHVRSLLSDFGDARLERACLRRADDIVAVTHAAATRIGVKRAQLRRPAPHVILSGIDNTRAGRRTNAGGPVRAVHVGSLYHSRDPGPLLEALAALRRRGELPEGGCSLEFIGDARWYGDVSVENLAKSLGIADLVQFRDTVPHADVEQILADADVLILLAQQQPVQVPNKLYEYLGHRKPILAFADADGETALMLRQAGNHFVVTEHDGGRTIDIVRAAIAAGIDPSWTPNDRQLDAWRTERQMAALVALVER
jgi:glycosyltransferase involved in cell wall biosynthesis